MNYYRAQAPHQPMNYNNLNYNNFQQQRSPQPQNAPPMIMNSTPMMRPPQPGNNMYSQMLNHSGMQQPVQAQQLQQSIQTQQLQQPLQTQQLQQPLQPQQLQQPLQSQQLQQPLSAQQLQQPLSAQQLQAQQLQQPIQNQQLQQQQQLRRLQMQRQQMFQQQQQLHQQRQMEAQQHQLQAQRQQQQQQQQHLPQQHQMQQREMFQHLTPQQLEAYQQQQIQRQRQLMQSRGYDPRYHQSQQQPQQPMEMRHMQHQIQLQQQQHQNQQHQSKRPSRNVSKKKKVYDVSSEDEEDFNLESEDSDHPASEFGDSDDERSRKKKSDDADAPVTIPMGTKIFERILDYRVHEGVEQLLIKYKNTSFLHLSWVPLKQIESEHLGKHRVKKFMQKYRQEGSRGEDYKDHLKIDRIVDEGELEDPTTGTSRIYYLVKWNGMFYDQATWETEEDVKNSNSVMLDEFLARKQIPPAKLSSFPPRPDASRFIGYTESPSYKYGNNLRAYQLEGLNWLRFCYYTFKSCILADEMGLGKTVQSVAFLNDIYHTVGIRGPFLIVAPLSTIPHWTRAFNAWTDLNVIDFRGSTTARTLIIETEFFYHDMEGKPIPNKYKFDVLITTYEMATASAPTLKDIPWRCGVFDEAHRLKNKNSKVLEILKTFYMDHKLLLTGTPLQNNLGELYSLLNFMQPDMFNDEARFFAEYGSLKSAHEVEKLQFLLKPIMLRRFKEDVEKTIPVKEETVIEVELTNPQKKWYRAILEKNFSFLKKGANSNKEMPHLRNIMMQLRKCCIHPYLLEGAEDVIVNECNAVGPLEQFNCLVQSSGKLVLIDKLLKKLIEGNHKVLIFSQFTSCLDILADYLRGRQYAYERIDGSVPGDQRQAAIDRFSTLPIEESFVFLLCTRAGGVGINLTAADTCIIFDSDWNPQNDLQAQARCHRIGQTKPVQIYRLICANTYEKDMFDRAGMKLGLDRAVMGQHDDGSANKTAELNRKEIEDLLKKGAYGAMLDDEASTKFCEEDIDQILERRTKVIRHEGNEKGSVFSKATFSTAEEGTTGVDLDDPDFWEKWAAKAQIDTSKVQEKNPLIMSAPRRRRQVQRFGSRAADGSYSSNDNDDSDAPYEEEPSTEAASKSSRRRDQVRPWTLSEKTKYERKLMIYGYGCWTQMVSFFPRRSEKDLKAVTRALMRKALPVIKNVKKMTEEDRRLIEDTENLLAQDAEEEAKQMPYVGATKTQTAEFKTFLAQAPEDYGEHIERKGRNFLLRIQMLHIIRDRIVPSDWEEAKVLEIPKVTGSPPAKWWGANEDRCLLLGICKHGYQQYLAMRNDPEFTFYGRKYDDSQSGGLEDDEPAQDKNDDHSRQGSVEPTPDGRKSYNKNEDDDSDYEDKKDEVSSDDDEEFLGKKKVYVWPSKADIGMRLRRIIAAFLREKANNDRKRKLQEKVQKKETDRLSRLRQRETRGPTVTASTGGRRTRNNDNRWTKKNKSDFIKTLMSFGVEQEEDDYRWDRFKEIANLERKTDESMTLHLREVLVSCEEAVKRHAAESGNSSAAAVAASGHDLETPASSPKDTVSRETSPEARETNEAVEDNEDNDNNENNENGDIISYDKARRSLKRIDQMNTLREKVLIHPDLDEILTKARKTSGLPSWWEVPKHDKALLEGVSKHGMGRTDLITEDVDLPFYHVKRSLTENEGSDESTKFVWPRDLVVVRRIDSLCELVLNPKRSMRQTRKRKPGSNGRGGRTKKIKSDETVEGEDGEPTNTKSDLSEEEIDEEYEDEEDQAETQEGDDIKDYSNQLENDEDDAEMESYSGYTESHDLQNL